MIYTAAPDINPFATDVRPCEKPVSNTVPSSFDDFNIDKFVESFREGLMKELEKHIPKPKNDEQVIIVRYEKGKLGVEDLSWLTVERPNGKYKDDEIALCAAAARVLSGDIPEISETKTAKILSMALLDHITQFMTEAIREVRKNVKS